MVDRDEKVGKVGGGRGVSADSEGRGQGGG